MFVIFHNKNSLAAGRIIDSTAKSHSIHHQKVHSKICDFLLYSIVRTRYNRKNETERKVVNDVANISSR